MDTHDTPEKDYNLERLVFFSDGVFAIVITLLALELHAPANWDHTLAGLWQELWRPLSAFSISFAAVGLFWNAHRMTFSQIVAFRAGLVFFNLLFLGLITLLPFLTTLIYERETTTDVIALYIMAMAAIAFTQALLWGYAALAADIVSKAFSGPQRWSILVVRLAAPALLGVWAWMVYAQRPQSEWLLVAAALAALRLLTRRLEATKTVKPSNRARHAS